MLALILLSPFFAKIQYWYVVLFSMIAQFTNRYIEKQQQLSKK